MTPQQTFTDPAAAALAEAAAAGDDARIRTLIADGADPNAQSARGLPLLQWAMLKQSRRGFEALLAAGADPTRGDSGGTTAVHLAAQADTPYWLETLLARGVSPDTPNTVTQATPLMAALMAARRENADRLINAGAQLDRADRQGDTALHVAALINDAGHVLQLLEAGANPSLRNVQGVTFQRYLFITKDSVLDTDARHQRDAVKAWLQQHGVPLEAAH
ncbi:ankyrin repeat domain-containing protein [Pseudonocardia benzenivorans]